MRMNSMRSLVVVVGIVTCVLGCNPQPDQNEPNPKSETPKRHPLTGDAATVPYQQERKSHEPFSNAYQLIPMEVRKAMHPLQKELIEKCNEFGKEKQTLLQKDFVNQIVKQQALAKFGSKRWAWAKDWQKRVIEQDIQDWVFLYDDKAGVLRFPFFSISVRKFLTNELSGKALLKVRDGQMVFVSIPVRDYHWRYNSITKISFPHVEKEGMFIRQTITPSLKQASTEYIVSLKPNTKVIREQLEAIALGELYQKRVLDVARQKSRYMATKFIESLVTGNRPPTLSYDNKQLTRLAELTPDFDWKAPLRDRFMVFLFAKELAKAKKKSNVFSEKMQRFEPKEIFKKYPVRLNPRYPREKGNPFHEEIAELVPSLITFDVDKEVYLVNSKFLANLKSKVKLYQRYNKRVDKRAKYLRGSKSKVGGNWEDIVVNGLQCWKDLLQFIELGLKNETIELVKDPKDIQ